MSNLEKKVDAIIRLLTAADSTSYDTAMARIRALEEPEQRKPDKMDARIETGRILTELGMPEHILGHSYNVEAIALAVEDKTIIHQMTDRLYPEVAARCGSTPTRTERAMRHAIELAWDRCDMDVAEKYFGSTVSPARGKPTNSEFIARIAGIVRQRVAGLPQ